MSLPHLVSVEGKREAGLTTKKVFWLPFSNFTSPNSTLRKRFFYLFSPVHFTYKSLFLSPNFLSLHKFYSRKLGSVSDSTSKEVLSGQFCRLHRFHTSKNLYKSTLDGISAFDFWEPGFCAPVRYVGGIGRGRVSPGEQGPIKTYVQNECMFFVLPKCGTAHPKSRTRELRKSAT